MVPSLYRRIVPGDGHPYYFIRVFSHADLIDVLNTHREDWWALEDKTQSAALQYLETEIGLRKITFAGATHQREFIRYLWRQPSPIEIASTPRSTAGLCHASTVFVHGLTEQLPEVLQVNYEQSITPAPPNLTPLLQENLNRAFRGK